MKIRILLGLLGGGCLVFVAASILSVRPTNQEREFLVAYKSLQIGMRADNVEKNFGRAPVFKCTFQGSPIHFYKPPPARSQWLDFRGEIDQSQFTNGQQIIDLNQIPDPYDHVAVAYDSDDTLIAYTHIGEEYHVYTKSRGAVKGSDFFRLQKSDFTPVDIGAKQAELLKP